MASKPLQNLALSTPVPGSTSSSTKRLSAVSTSRPWTVVRVMVSSRVSKEFEHVAQGAAGAGGLGAELLERQPVAVDPQRAVAIPGGGQRVPRVAAHEQDLL